MGGIKGDVVFSQPQDNGPTTIMVNLTGVNETLTWNIHQLPMIYDGNAAMSCNVGALFDPKSAQESPDYNVDCRFSSSERFGKCAVGDLAKMFGDLTESNAQQNHTNSQLMIPITGPYSIMGRTLVLFSGSTAKACALITPAQSMKTAVAVFKFPVAGFVYLRQVDENSDTSVFADLFFVNNAESASQFSWKINQGVVSDDASDPSLYCKNVGQMFNPTGMKDENCNPTMHDNCAIGDLTSKHGKISVSVATAMRSSRKAAFTDTNLPLSGNNRVIEESIVLFSDNNAKNPVACAKIVHLEPKTQEASFNADDNDGVSGKFKFTQLSPFDPTTTEINLSGLQNKAEGYHVHAYPSPSYRQLTPSEACAGLIAGDHWNPFNVDIKTSPAAGTGEHLCFPSYCYCCCCSQAFFADVLILIHVTQQLSVPLMLGGGVIPYKNYRGALRTFKGLKAVLVPLRVFSLQTSLAGAFAVPFRVLCPKKFDSSILNILY